VLADLNLDGLEKTVFPVREMRWTTTAHSVHLQVTTLSSCPSFSWELTLLHAFLKFS
jgi:hypothetical protein